MPKVWYGETVLSNEDPERGNALEGHHERCWQEAIETGEKEEV